MKKKKKEKKLSKRERIASILVIVESGVDGYKYLPLEKQEQRLEIADTIIEIAMKTP